MIKNTILAVVVVALGASTLMNRSRIATLESELAARPPVIVVDQTRIAMQALSGDFTEYDIEDHTKKFDRALQALRASGALVIRSDAVLTSPAAVTVSAADLGLSRQDKLATAGVE